jgi:predicted DNA-binding transcriptional regulator YafY
MDSLQRIYKLHQAISTRRQPVSCQTLRDELECSRATVKRIIAEMRSYFNAPLEYDRSRNGYHYSSVDGQSFELPGCGLPCRALRTADRSAPASASAARPARCTTATRSARIEQIPAATYPGDKSPIVSVSCA